MQSNSAGVELIHKVLITFGIDPNVVTLLPATHEATGEMLNAVGYHASVHNVPLFCVRPVRPGIQFSVVSAGGRQVNQAAVMTVDLRNTTPPL